MRSVRVVVAGSFGAVGDVLPDNVQIEACNRAINYLLNIGAPIRSVNDNSRMHIAMRTVAAGILIFIPYYRSACTRTYHLHSSAKCRLKLRLHLHLGLPRVAIS